MDSTNYHKNGVIFSRIMVNYVLTKVYSLLTSFLRLAKFLVLWSTIYLAEIKLCEFALFIYLFIHLFILYLK